MLCIVNYSGNWAPEMKLQHDGGPVIIEGYVVNKTVPYKTVKCKLNIRATRNMTGSKYLCLTSFSATNKPSSTTAQNVPEYGDIWQSSSIIVECKYKHSIQLMHYSILWRIFRVVTLIFLISFIFN